MYLFYDFYFMAFQRTFWWVCQVIHQFLNGDWVRCGWVWCPLMKICWKSWFDYFFFDKNFKKFKVYFIYYYFFLKISLKKIINSHISITNSLKTLPRDQQSYSIYYLFFGQSIKITLQILDKYRCIYAVIFYDSA